jgi:ElaB/YqjD/DUF883 family membrane-anchored ribosome-binding protein
LRHCGALTHALRDSMQVKVAARGMPDAVKVHEEDTMGTHNGSYRFDSARHFVDEKLDAAKSGMQKVLDRVMTRPDGTPSQIRAWSTTATDAIKTHPYVAVGIALGAGYMIVKIARR